MTVAQQHPHGANRLISLAWIANALVPVALVVAALIGFASEGETATFRGSFLYTLIVMAVPTAAVVLGALAAHAHLRSGRRAEVIAVLLIAAVAVLLPLFVTAFSIGWIAAVAVAALIALVAIAALWGRVEKLRG